MYGPLLRGVGPGAGGKAFCRVLALGISFGRFDAGRNFRGGAYLRRVKEKFVKSDEISILKNQTYK